MFLKDIKPILCNIIDLFKGLRNARHHVRIPGSVKADVHKFLQWCDTFNGMHLFLKLEPLGQSPLVILMLL